MRAKINKLKATIKSVAKAYKPLANVYGNML